MILFVFYYTKYIKQMLIFIHMSHQVGFNTRPFNMRPRTNRSSCAVDPKNAWSLRRQTSNLALQSGYCLGGGQPPGPDAHQTQRSGTRFFIDSPGKRTKSNVDPCLSLIPNRHSHQIRKSGISLLSIH